MGADLKRREIRARKFANLSQNIQETRNAPQNYAVEPACPAKRSRMVQEPCQNLASRTTEMSVSTKYDNVSADIIPQKPIAQKQEVDSVPRFICFIGMFDHSWEICTLTRKRFFAGNLPFTATSESIGRHFSKVQPFSVRHRTIKNTSKSKGGFAFLEFESCSGMATCLRLYHHSIFDDGSSPARKINVELTYAAISLRSVTDTSRANRKLVLEVVARKARCGKRGYPPEI